MYSLQFNLFFNTIRVVFDAKTPLRRIQSLLQYTFRPRNASTKHSARISNNLNRRKRVQADQPVNDPVILPERDTNPEWEALLDRLDVATEEADETALIAEAIRTIYPYEGRKMQIEAIRVVDSRAVNSCLYASTGATSAEPATIVASPKDGSS